MSTIDSRRYMAIHRKGTKQPLFWVQAALVQTPVLQQLEPDQPVYCIYRLKQDHSERTPTFAEIAAYHIETMRSLCPRGPYALAGYCICATIAYEMARQLREQGEQVSALIMIDPVDPLISRGGVVREPALFRARQLFNRVLFGLRKLSAAPDKLAYCKRSLRAIQLRMVNRRMAEQGCDTVDCAAPPKRENAQDVHDSDMYAFINCVPKPYSGNATIVRPTWSPARAYEYPNRRWKQIIHGGIDERRTPGDSDNMWLMPNAQGMSEIIASCLRQSSTATTERSFVR